MTFDEVKAHAERVIALGLNDKAQEFCEAVLKAIEQTRWIPIDERLPSRDEYMMNNGLFNVSDGNRSYCAYFDIYTNQKFGRPTINGFSIDLCVIAWKPLLERYKIRNEEINDK